MKTDIKNQYDQIADNYSKTKEGVLKKRLIEKPTFIHFLKDEVKDKDVIDLACGEGFYTRIIKQLGANKVVGLDVSDEQIKIAEEKERVEPLGIKYFTKDVAGYNSSDGQFGTVTAGYLLGYEDEEDQLLAVCKGVYESVKPGGKFITLVDNPDMQIPNDPKYGLLVTSPEENYPIQNGEKKTMTFFDDGGEELVSFIKRHRSREKIEETLTKVGFVDISWHDPIIGDEAIKEKGEKFWDGYKQNPDFKVLICRKPD